MSKADYIAYDTEERIAKNGMLAFCRGQLAQFFESSIQGEEAVGCTKELTAMTKRQCRSCPWAGHQMPAETPTSRIRLMPVHVHARNLMGCSSDQLLHSGIVFGAYWS